MDISQVLLTETLFYISLMFLVSILNVIQCFYKKGLWKIINLIEVLIPAIIATIFPLSKRIGLINEFKFATMAAFGIMSVTELLEFKHIWDERKFFLLLQQKNSEENAPKQKVARREQRMIKDEKEENSNENEKALQEFRMRLFWAGANLTLNSFVFLVSIVIFFGVL